MSKPTTARFNPPAGPIVARDLLYGPLKEAKFAGPIGVLHSRSNASSISLSDIDWEAS
jgi:hypothetical protein